jgi:parvulin-like peptidyl-prolyl isomerase
MICSRTAAAGIMVFCALLSMAGCGMKDGITGLYRSGQSETAAVQIGTKDYSRSDLDRYFDGRLSEFREPAYLDQVKSNLLESFIEEKLLLIKAEQTGIKSNPQTVRIMMEKIKATGAGNSDENADSDQEVELQRAVEDNLKMQQYLHDFVAKNVSVSDRECESYYKEHLGDYVQNDVVRVSEILVDDLGLAQKLLAMLKEKSSKNFGDLARVYSKGASAADGGYLGSFQRGELPDEFEKAIFVLAPGASSKIVSTKYGYHIFGVQQRIPAHQQKFIEVHDQIREKLLLEREREIIDRELASLRKSIPVVIHRESLDFNYLAPRRSNGEGSIQ